MQVWLWLGFLAFVIVLLAIDLLVINRKSHAVETREALMFTGFFVGLALAFAGVVYVLYDNNLFNIAAARDPQTAGWSAMTEYLAGWVVEYSLSLDNLFVIALIFTYFKVPREHQHRVLFWGIMGALIMRGVMIAVGAALIHRLHWIIYVFGVILLWSAWKMLRSGEEGVDPSKNWLVNTAKRVVPVTPDFQGEKFFSRVDGRFAITPMFLVLLVVESTDVIFAVDSIPAIFGITKDPFLVFTSNVFAILGLRSLYFALAALMDKLRYLKASLVFVLAFVGFKMLLADLYHIKTSLSLGVITGILAMGILASLVTAGIEPDWARADDRGRRAFQAWNNAKRLVVVVIGTTALLAGVAADLAVGYRLAVAAGAMLLIAAELAWGYRLLAAIARENQLLADRLTAARSEPGLETPPDSPDPAR